MHYTIYYHDDCKYCRLAKELLTQEGHSFTKHDVRDPKIGAEFRNTGFATVPQIFRGESYIGGYEALVRHLRTLDEEWDFPSD